MTVGVAFLIALALTGTVALCVALEILPKFGKYGSDSARRPHYFWIVFNVGCGLLLLVSFLALKWAYAEPEKKVKKYYNIPQQTWYFATPHTCKKVMNGGVPYTPETFAARHECKTQEVDENPYLIKLDCKEMLSNIFFMVKGQSECERLQAVMQREAGLESIFGYPGE